MRVPAHAKINLTLHVTGRREDGYHLLDSLVVFARLADYLSLTDEPGLRLCGPRAAGLPDGADNLVGRAARLVGAGNAGIVLEKHLPSAAGMGGGSADAAAALHLLARARGLTLPPVQALMTLGADVPVCMAAPQPSRMRGLGEQVSTVPAVPALWLVIVNPGVPLSTPSVFKDLKSPDNLPMPEILPHWSDARDLCQWLQGMRNDLEAPACALVPQIGLVLKRIAAQPGCLLARMTGSGATCFGIFDQAAARDAAVSALERPDWYVSATQTAHPAPA